MRVSLSTRGRRRVLFPLAALAPVVGSVVAVVAHERYTATHGSGFEGHELLNGPVYRTGISILLAGELLLVTAVFIWSLGLSSSLPGRRTYVGSS